MTAISLRSLAPGQTVIISTVRARGDLGRRIREMGLIPGTRVTIYGRAPLQDPVALKIGGSVITLRNNEADHILVDLP